MSQTPYDPTKKMLGREKLSRIPIKIDNIRAPLRKPDWIRIKLNNSEKINRIKNLMREHQLHTVCEEATCPNLNECFGHGTATFMIMGDKCTRRCAFCDVAHGRPDPLDVEEPIKIAKSVEKLQLKYVVITSVDRDDLRDGGALHFAYCIQAIRERCPNTKIEILVPDYRGRLEKALEATGCSLPDVFNHNIETVPRLYKQARPGADYHWSLQLLKKFKERYSNIPTKSGMMLGLGETEEEIRRVLDDLRTHDVDMITLGQYLQPTQYHMPVDRYVTPQEFITHADYAKKIGFKNVASGPLVRSSYHAELQSKGDLIK